MPRKKATNSENTTVNDAGGDKRHYVNTPFSEADYSLYTGIAEAFHKANVIKEPKVSLLIKWSMQKLAEDLMQRRKAQLKEELKKQAQFEYEQMIREKYPALFDSNPAKIRERI